MIRSLTRFSPVASNQRHGEPSQLPFCSFGCWVAAGSHHSLGPSSKLSLGENQEVQLIFLQTSILGPDRFLEERWRRILASPPKQQVTCIWWFLIQLLVLTPCIFLGPLKDVKNKEHCWNLRGDWSLAINSRCERHFCAPVIAPWLVSDYLMCPPW